MLGLHDLCLWLLAGCGLVLALQVALLLYVIRGSRRRRFDDLAAKQESVVERLPAPSAATTNDVDGNEQLFRAVFDTVECQVCLLDESGVILEANRGWNRFIEGTPLPKLGQVGSMYARFCRDGGVFLGASANELAEAMALIAAGELTEFSGGYTALIGGEERTLGVRLVPLSAGGRTAIMVLQHDNTPQRDSERLIRQEQRKAETLASALEASQASLELAMRGGELGLWYWDVGAGYFELSIDWLVRLGKNAAADGGLNADVESFRELIHPDELVFWTADDAASLAPDEPYDRQFRLRWPDGQYRWVQVLGRTNSVDPTGIPESLSGVLIDIHDRKSSELRDAGMAKIIEESHNEVYVVDCDTTHFLVVNRGARENLGYTLEELRGITPAALHPGMTEGDLRELWGPLVRGEAERLELETAHKRRDGSVYPTMLTLQKARLVDHDVIVAIGVDLTQRRSLESQLAEAQRLESIGQLAAGIAHEMNTPLQFIGNNIRFLSNCSDAILEVLDSLDENLDPNGQDLPWEERRRLVLETMERTNFDHIRKETPRAIDDSLEGVERVLQIVRAMKEFSHPGDHEMVPTDLNRSLQSTATVTRNHWKDEADLRLELEPGLPCVECEGGAINQVFVNLIVNAADAVASRRREDPSAPAGSIVVRSFAEGQHAVFEVEDNGCGMPDEVRRRAFDPFFTTKEVGLGTGQGLSLTHTIITKNHRGEIDIDTTPGEGTVIRLRLPFQASPQQATSLEPLAIGRES